MHPAEELKARTKKFADDIVQLCGELPRTTLAQRLANQLQDAGTSVGANYRGACQARSRREFISKMAPSPEAAPTFGFFRMKNSGAVNRGGRIVHEPYRMSHAGMSNALE